MCHHGSAGQTIARCYESLERYHFLQFRRIQAKGGLSICGEFSRSTTCSGVPSLTGQARDTCRGFVLSAQGSALNLPQIGRFRSQSAIEFFSEVVFPFASNEGDVSSEGVSNFSEFRVTGTR